MDCALKLLVGFSVGLFLCASAYAETVAGSEDFIHLDKVDGTWWLVDAEGERFVVTGMNHISFTTRFAPYNKDFWLEEFGPGLFDENGVVWHGAEAKSWLCRIVKDHKDYGFSTIAFHHPPELPSEYFEELGIHYLGKLKLGETSHLNVVWGGGFPDVFSDEWQTESERRVQAFTAKHKDNKHLIGYTYSDLPEYAYEAFLQRHEWQIQRFDVYVLHPWIEALVSRPGMPKAKQIWVDVLKGRYPSAAAAGVAYDIEVETWDDFAEISEWGLPDDEEQGIGDMTVMSKIITETWLKTHHDLIRKYDPNHLILGDKVSAHGPAQPDWVWELVSKYVDVVLIQDFEFFDEEHEAKLRHIHEKTGKPIINGDHAYATLRPNMRAHKGVPVENLTRVGEEYTRYTRGTMALPFMLGWQYCGYIEQWAGATNDSTGQEQPGFFDPFGEPLVDALVLVKKANESAVSWHEAAEIETAED